MNLFDQLSEEKRNRILQVSIKEFAEHGYELASTNRIVMAAQISKGSLFKYFSSKLSLYMYLVAYATADLTQYLDHHLQLKGKLNWQDYLLHHSSVEFDYLITHPFKYKFFRNVVMEMNLDTLNQVKADLLSLTNHYLASMRKDLEIDADLFRHLMFIIKGYNEYFLEQYDSSELNETLKKRIFRRSAETFCICKGVSKKWIQAY